MSTRIGSPSRTKAIGPPSAASGAMCPMHSPVVPPENRPSVTSRTSLPSPAPLIAPVIASISRIPGPPFGPSYRMTTTSPARMAPSARASIAARSRSKTRAVPSKTAASKPADLTTAPRGASEPCRMVMPPVGWIGSASLRMTSPSAAGACRSARFSAMVRPVTVSGSPCSRPASSRACSTTGMPPMRSTSVITCRPNGFRSPRCGTRAPIRAKSSRVSSTSASWAMASRCSTALVEPPSAMITVIAFSNAGLVRMSRAVMPCRSRLTTASPDARA